MDGNRWAILSEIESLQNARASPKATIAPSFTQVLLELSLRLISHSPEAHARVDVIGGAPSGKACFRQESVEPIPTTPEARKLGNSVINLGEPFSGKTELTNKTFVVTFQLLTNNRPRRHRSCLSAPDPTPLNWSFLFSLHLNILVSSLSPVSKNVRSSAVHRLDQGRRRRPEGLCQCPRPVERCCSLLQIRPCRCHLLLGNTRCPDSRRCVRRFLLFLMPRRCPLSLVAHVQQISVFQPRDRCDQPSRAVAVSPRALEPL